MIYPILLAVHFIVCVFLIILVLMQHGKGAEMGAAFGSGASSTVFGSTGSAHFLTKLTAFFAAAFFASSLCMTYFVSRTYNASLPKAAETQSENISPETIPSSEQTDLKSAPEDTIPSHQGATEEHSPGIRVIPDKSSQGVTIPPSEGPQDLKKKPEQKRENKSK